MSKLTINFANTMLHAVKARENKIRELAEGLEAFLRSALVRAPTEITLDDELQKVSFSLETASEASECVLSLGVREGNDDGDYIGGLEVCIGSDGNVGFILADYDDADQVGYAEWDMDGLSIEDAAAKILTTIQMLDSTVFGPILTAEMQRIWASEEFGFDPRYAPGTGVVQPQ